MRITVRASENVRLSKKDLSSSKSRWQIPGAEGERLFVAAESQNAETDLWNCTSK